MRESIKIVFSEYNSKNEIDVKMVKKYFPEAEIQINTPENSVNDVFDKNHPRYGWRMHDFNNVRGLIHSSADITICLDADMKIINKDVRTIIPLVKKFGACLPFNNRGMVRVDTLKGADSDKKLDETKGTASAFNTAIAAFYRPNHRARAFFESALVILKNQKIRLPLVYWRAAYLTGFYPCLLPVQWCVCEGDEGCGNEIILHVGHNSVKEYYKM